MGGPAAAFYPQDGKADGLPAGSDSPAVAAMVDEGAVMAAGRTLELADVHGIYGIIIKFLGNSIAIGDKYGYHSSVDVVSAGMPAACVYLAGIKLWTVGVPAFLYINSYGEL